MTRSRGSETRPIKRPRQGKRVMTLNLKALAAVIGIVVASGAPAHALSLNDPLSTWLETPLLQRVQIAGWVASNPGLKEGRPDIIAVDLAGCMDEVASWTLSPRKTVANAAVTCVQLL